MEPLFQHIYLKEEESYNILKVNRPYFVVPWHQHPEVEIMSIVHGEGNRFVGDSVENYERGDLAIVGSNVPHCWKSGSRHYQEDPLFRAKARVILFKQESFGDEFFNISEMKSIKNLLLRAERGVLFDGKTRARATEGIAQAYAQSGLKRFLTFLEVLYMLAESKEYRLLASVNYKSNVFDRDMQRLNKVFDYLMLNYQKEVRLEEVAAEACMSVTAFCRYFKMHTNKTVFSFLNEIRVGYAKKLLMEKTDKINDIHYRCGFYNSSNFYEQFKKIVGCTPLQFRKQHEGKATLGKE